MSASIVEPPDRTDGPDKVRGSARYTADIALPGLAHAAIVQSTIAAGRIVHIDADRAAHAPGVLAVLTHENAQRLPEGGNAGYGPPAGRIMTLLQDDTVHYNGQPIAVVVAESREEAHHAASLAHVRYHERAPVLDFAAGMAHATKPEDEDEDDYSRGDPEQALDAASVRMAATYTTPLEYHNPMEPHATTAVWEGERLTLYDSTQFISGVRKVAAKAFGMPEAHVRVVSHHVGGGFGGKGSVWSHVVLAAMAARAVGRPVRLALDRTQMYGPVGYRPRTEQHIAIGAAEDGRLEALTHDFLSDTSKIEEWTENCGSTTRMLYLCPDVRTSARLVKLDIGTPTFLRAPGHTPGSFALESAMDELAHRIGIDPVELRLRNHADRDPEREQDWSSKSLRECYARGVELFGWARRNPEPRSMREGNALIGLGMATATYPAHRMRASASAEFLPDGTALVRSGTQEIGTGTYTVMTQIAAATLGVPRERVRFELGDTVYPRAPITAGSMTVASVGPAVEAVCRRLREQLIALAIGDAVSPLGGLEPSAIDISGGVLVSRLNPLQRETIASLLGRHGAPLRAEVDHRPGDESRRYSMHGFGAVFAEVRVDAELGMVSVPRIVGCYGVGRVINAGTARSQVMGGIVWGIGMALHEQALLDVRTGRIVNANLAEYLVPVNADIGRIDVQFVEEHDPHVNSLGAKGIGEIGITGVAAAIANAVFNATGRRIRDLPITIEKLL
jgi:xanthine dehydrogenase YagR molybdenum-binding subunit